MDSTALRSKPKILPENCDMVHIYWLYYNSSAASYGGLWVLLGGKMQCALEPKYRKLRCMGLRLSVSVPC